MRISYKKSGNLVSEIDIFISGDIISPTETIKYILDNYSSSYYKVNSTIYDESLVEKNIYKLKILEKDISPEELTKSVSDTILQQQLTSSKVHIYNHTKMDKSVSENEVSYKKICDVLETSQIILNAKRNFSKHKLSMNYNKPSLPDLIAVTLTKPPIEIT